MYVTSCEGEDVNTDVILELIRKYIEHEILEYYGKR